MSISLQLSLSLFCLSTFVISPGHHLSRYSSPSQHLCLSKSYALSCATISASIVHGLSLTRRNLQSSLTSSPLSLPISPLQRPALPSVLPLDLRRTANWDGWTAALVPYSPEATSPRL
ncbi:hypothetical protein MRB53_030702 [Persea americana]|uniref:Uncharacterized protein n=1 Tax=Persea americana TaxID=3435 RepID=A0ACC2KMC2_PERAE|nr:hypothetical protein MRB53_030702 [Persea americana]